MTTIPLTAAERDVFRLVARTAKKYVLAAR